MVLVARQSDVSFFIRFGFVLYCSARYTHPVSLPSKSPLENQNLFRRIFKLVTDVLVCMRHFRLPPLHPNSWHRGLYVALSVVPPCAPMSPSVSSPHVNELCGGMRTVDSSGVTVLSASYSSFRGPFFAVGNQRLTCIVCNK
jgi:hypothetical protein